MNTKIRANTNKLQVNISSFFIGIMKLCITLQFLFLYCYYAYFVDHIPNLTNILGFITLLAMLMDVMYQKKITIYYEFLALLLFSSYILLTSLFNEHSNVILSSLINLIEKIALIFEINYICLSEKKRTFPLVLMIGISIITGGIILLRYPNFYGRLYIGPSLTPNIIGSLMLSGIVCMILYKSEIERYSLSIIDIIFLSVYILVIIYTASRQALLLGLAYIVTYLFIKNKFSSNGITLKQIFKIFLIIAIIIVTMDYIVSILLDSKLWLRIIGQDKSTTISDGSRVILYTNGIRLWLNNILFGVGYNCTQYYFGYSHSTYLEILAGTGILGFIIFAFPTIKIINVYFNNLKKNENKIRIYSYFVALIVLLLLAFTKSIIYYLEPMVLIGVQINYVNTYYKKKFNK